MIILLHTMTTVCTSLQLLTDRHLHSHTHIIPHNHHYSTHKYLPHTPTDIIPSNTLHRETSWMWCITVTWVTCSTSVRPEWHCRQRDSNCSLNAMLMLNCKDGTYSTCTFIHCQHTTPLHHNYCHENMFCPSLSCHASWFEFITYFDTYRFIILIKIIMFTIPFYFPHFFSVSIRSMLR